MTLENKLFQMHFDIKSSIDVKFKSIHEYAWSNAYLNILCELLMMRETGGGGSGER